MTSTRSSLLTSETGVLLRSLRIAPASCSPSGVPDHSRSGTFFPQRPTCLAGGCFGCSSFEAAGKIDHAMMGVRQPVSLPSPGSTSVTGFEPTFLDRTFARGRA